MASRKELQSGEIELNVNSENDAYSDEEGHETSMRQIHPNGNSHKTGGRILEITGVHTFTRRPSGKKRHM